MMTGSIFRKSRMLNHLRPFIKILPYLATCFKCRGPKVVDIELTNRCNLHCARCWFYGESGVGDKYRDSELSTQEVLGLIDQLSKYRPVLYLGGAEPFIRQDLLIILEYIQSRGLSFFFTTNGTLLDRKRIEALVALGADNITFSVDGHEELHDEIRGQGNFKRVTQAIKKLSEYKKKTGSRKPVITVNLGITPDLVGHLQESINAVRDATTNGVDLYRIHHLWYVTREELSSHQSELEKYMQCKAPGSASHLIPNSQISDPLSLATEISLLGDQQKISSFPCLSSHELVEYYSTGRVVRKRCVAPFFGVVVKPNGDVKFCPDEWIDDFVLGNIRKDRFDHIWNGDKARKFRSVLFKKGYFAGCKRCSWMYAF
jgi:radical SAM protein with 4Fe4S-binding SPASM domain